MTSWRAFDGRTRVWFVVAALLLCATGTQAGNYVPVTLYPYLETKWDYSLKFTVEGYAVWEGSQQSWGKFQVNTTATGSDYQVLDEPEDWCTQGLISQPCPVPGRGWGAVYSAPHYKGRTITCKEKNNCAGTGNQRYRNCDYYEILKYWGYTQVYPTTIDRSSLIVVHTGPKRRVTECMEILEPDWPPLCEGEWVGTTCCCDVFDLGDGIQLCLEQC